MFNIEWVANRRGRSAGKITIGDFWEYFESDLSYWNRRKYERHWVKACQDIVNGAEKSVLFNTMYPLDKANFLMCWPMYRQGNTVVFRNKMLFIDQMPKDMDVARPETFISDYVPSPTNEEDHISEWRIPVSELQAFLERKRESYL